MGSSSFAMVREAYAMVALHAEAIGALWSAHGRVADRSAIIEAMKSRSDAPRVDSDLADARRVGRALARATRLVPRSTCLVIAVAGYEILARRGIRTTLCIGHDALSAGAFSAHAWLELNGQAVVGQPSANRFTR